MLITLLTDFGNSDYFVGAMKGVILTINPHASIVDITHEIQPQNILSGAFTLGCVYQNFPEETIHVAVVDPGVGSTRRAIIAATSNQFFVGPDNGLFSFIYERETNARVFHVTNEDYFRQPVSATFHGRDVFAPVAAVLSTGVVPEKLGVEINDYVRLAEIRPRLASDRIIEAAIIHIDHFGNCITNLTRDDISEEMIERGATLKVNGQEIKSFRRFFAEGEGNQESPFAIWGSAGFLEIAAFRASAARKLSAQTGHLVKVTSDN
jgi:S-adenosyl-L-methionine hydrolase (adenosine-forming)